MQVISTLGIVWKIQIDLENNMVLWNQPDLDCNLGSVSY